MDKSMITHTEKLMVKNNAGVAFDCTEIEDLWHIAMALPARTQEIVLEVWHQAHAMRDHIKRGEK